jgi:hypothetical protein
MRYLHSKIKVLARALKRSKDTTLVVKAILLPNSAVDPGYWFGCAGDACMGGFCAVADKCNNKYTLLAVVLRQPEAQNIAIGLQPSSSYTMVKLM